MVGTSLARYELLATLGVGGMSVVYKARDTRLDRLAAIKILKNATADEDCRRRFSQEARAASALNHPGIITIYDVARHGDVDFIAMEFVQGKTIEELIAQKTLSLSSALDYAVQAARALVDGSTRTTAHGAMCTRSARRSWGTPAFTEFAAADSPGVQPFAEWAAVKATEKVLVCSSFKRVDASVFAITQIAASFVLLAGAGMLLTTLIALQRTPAGFETRRVLGAPAGDVLRPDAGSERRVLSVHLAAGRAAARRRSRVLGSAVPWRDRGFSLQFSVDRQRAVRRGSDAGRPADRRGCNPARGRGDPRLALAGGPRVTCGRRAGAAIGGAGASAAGNPGGRMLTSGPRLGIVELCLGPTGFRPAR